MWSCIERARSSATTTTLFIRSCSRLQPAASLVLQVYDEGETPLKLNQVVEFVGVLSRVPQLGVPDPALGPEELAARPPTSQARINLIAFLACTGHSRSEVWSTCDAVSALVLNLVHSNSTW